MPGGTSMRRSSLLLLSSLYGLAVCASASASAALPPAPRRGIWQYFCFDDTASIAGSSPPHVYSDLCWQEQTVAKAPAAQGTLLMIKWRHIQPTSSRSFDWAPLDRNITRAAKLGLQVIVAVEICKADPGDPAAPAWLYDAVPGVNFTHVPKGGVVPPGTTNPHRCPNYLDPRFQAYFRTLINAFAAHLASLPEPTVRASVVGVQAMLGITGDDRPWDGVPIDPTLRITDDAWNAYTRKMAGTYCDAFTRNTSASGTGTAATTHPQQLRVLFNLENPGVEAHGDPWVMTRCPGAMLKQGIVSHGYQLNGELDLYNQWTSLGLRDAFLRGELAVEPNPAQGTYGNWAQSPAWSLQANAEWALTFGLDSWNLYAGFLSNDTFAPTLDFFNRQAATPETDVAHANAAFLSFRDSLDSADTTRFPEAEFGAVNSSAHAAQLNGDRMLKIVAAFATYGARVDDVQEARSVRSIVQKKGMHLNDVGWRIWPGNYRKFMRQVDASGSSVGRWRVGDPREAGGYGRFARALEHATGKAAIRVALVPGFAAAHRDAATGVLNVTVRVVYLDQGTGRWVIQGLGLEEEEKKTPPPMVVVTNTDSGRWRVAEARMAIIPTPRRSTSRQQQQIKGTSGAGTAASTASTSTEQRASGSSGGSRMAADFELRSLDGADEVFSLMEVLVL